MTALRPLRAPPHVGLQKDGLGCRQNITVPSTNGAHVAQLSQNRHALAIPGRQLAAGGFFPKASAQASSKKKTFAQAHQLTYHILPPPHYYHHTDHDAATTTLAPPHFHHYTIPPHYHHYTTHHATTTTLPSPQCYLGCIASARCLLSSLLFLRLGWVFAAASAMHPSAGIVRVGAPSLCVFAPFETEPHTL